MKFFAGAEYLPNDFRKSNDQEDIAMVTSIEFPKTDTASSDSYIYTLPALAGKKFCFKHGFNIVCGYNGCGKSTMLGVIRKLTFCDQHFSSSMFGEFAYLKISKLASSGIYDGVILKNDWRYSCFSMLRNSEEANASMTDSPALFAHAFQRRRQSDGMNTLISYSKAFQMMKDASDGVSDLHDYGKYVTHANISSGESIATTKSPILSKIRNYQCANQVDAEGLTIIFDEPDKSVDIVQASNMIQSIMRSSVKESKNSVIMCLHNAIVLYHLIKSCRKNINFIELTPGFLDNIVRFVETGKASIPDMWWLPDEEA